MAIRNFIERSPSLHTSLLQQLVDQPGAKVFLWVRHADVTWPPRVLKDVVAAVHPPQSPARGFEQLNQVAAAHGGYCNHRHFAWLMRPVPCRSAAPHHAPVSAQT
jgi:hypothetical protein